MMFPILLGSDAEFSALRDALLACDYTEAAICSRFHIHRVSELRLEGSPAPDTCGLNDVVRLLVHLLIEGAALQPSSASPLPIRELESLGLVTVHPDRIVANVLLYPTRHLYIVSDRTRPAEGDPLLDDIVYPAIVPNTDLFLDHLPPGANDAFLDLCAGTGIAALVAAQSGARHAWAFDITARSTHFAEFNRRLNALPNVTAAEGDLYQPAADDTGDQTFDRIVAHPPYLPVYRPRFVFDSGGQDGEQIVRRIVEGLPRYLRPGGKFFALTMGSDRDQPFEHRLRDWLGADAGEFDVAFIVRKTISPHDYSADAVLMHKGSLQDIAGWRDLFAEWGVRSLAYGFVVIQRRQRDRAVFTVRHDSGPKTGPAECAWLIEWTTAALDTQKLLAMKPHARDNASLRVEHRFAAGAWNPESYRLASEYPFSSTMNIEPWAPHLLTIANGTSTIRKLLDQLKSAGGLPDSVEPEEFARVVAAMVSAGFLEVDECKIR